MKKGNLKFEYQIANAKKWLVVEKNDDLMVATDLRVKIANLEVNICKKTMEEKAIELARKRRIDEISKIKDSKLKRRKENVDKRLKVKEDKEIADLRKRSGYITRKKFEILFSLDINPQVMTKKEQK